MEVEFLFAGTSYAIKRKVDKASKIYNEAKKITKEEKGLESFKVNDFKYNKILLKYQDTFESAKIAPNASIGVYGENIFAKLPPSSQTSTGATNSLSSETEADKTQQKAAGGVAEMIKMMNSGKITGGCCTAGFVQQEEKKKKYQPVVIQKSNKLKDMINGLTNALNDPNHYVATSPGTAGNPNIGAVINNQQAVPLTSDPYQNAFQQAFAQYTLRKSSAQVLNDYQNQRISFSQRPVAESRNSFAVENLFPNRATIRPSVILKQINDLDNSGILEEADKNQTITITIDVHSKDLGKNEFEKSNINKEIFFIADRNGNGHKFSYDEFTPQNTTVFIDNVSVPFAKSHIFNTDGVHKVKLIFNHHISSCHNMFSFCYYITEIAFEKINISHVKDVSNMFYMCNSLRIIEGVGFLRLENCENFSYLFGSCFKLRSLNGMSFWNTSSATDMHNMFAKCYCLTNLEGTCNFKTNKVKNMEEMFSHCHNVKAIKAGSWDTSNVKSMNSMFSNCNTLLRIEGLEKWKTENVKDMSCLFDCCNKIKEIKGIGAWNTSNVKDMNSMFSNCNMLNKIDSLEKWDTSKVETMYDMFKFCGNLLQLNGLECWRVDSLTDVTDMFAECKKLKSLKIKQNLYNKIGEDLPKNITVQLA